MLLGYHRFVNVHEKNVLLELPQEIQQQNEVLDDIPCGSKTLYPGLDTILGVL